MARICSLVPSATEIVCALGLQDDLVGVSHECDYPPVARQKAILTRSTIDISESSASIDAQVSASLRDGGSLYALDAALLEQLEPGLILTQELCTVCAVSFDDVCLLAGGLRSRPRVLSLDPHSLAGIMDNVREVAAACGVAARGDALVAALRRRIEVVSERVGVARRRPRVVCLEWLDPPFGSGHWVPEMVALAGGAEWLGRCGGLSRPLAWADIMAADPDVVIVMCCGFSVARTLAEMGGLRAQPAWTGLRAVREGRVFVTDGAAYFSRPGPRMAEGIELLASCLHPDLWHQRFGEQEVVQLAAPF